MAGGLLAGLRHRDFALFSGAFATSAIGSWAYNVALAVWLVHETGSPTWIAAATVVRFVPALLLSAYGGVLAERFEQTRLMVVLDLVCAVAMAAMALCMAVGAPPAAVLLCAAITSTVGIAYEPAAAAMTPRLVPERDLGSANALRNTIDNVCVVAGPGIGAVLLLVADPWLAVALNVASFVVSAVLVAMMRTRSEPVDVTEGGTAGPVQQMLVGVRTIGTSSTALVLVGFCVLATFVYGLDTVLFVVLSDERLGTGPEGYGYLLAGLGVGGVLAAPVVTRLERLPRLAPVVLLGMVGYCLPTLAFLVVDRPSVAFALQVVRGASTLVVDVLAITALQRSLPVDVLGRVFGAFNAICLLAVLVGASMVPPMVDAWGLDGALWFASAGIAVVSLAGWPWLARMDRQAAERRAALAPAISLLDGCAVFEAVGDGAMTELAGAAAYVDVAAGHTVIRAGEPADAFYVVDAGLYDATGAGDVLLSQMGEGGWFGEIGLLNGSPRTATVTARTDGRLLRVDGPAFLAALTETTPSAAFVDGARLRLARTNPGDTLTEAWKA
ncbi:MFS transporter [Nocardioides mangrovi]|uniref:MFS transporter n=1 Tax=Nocardioides mangrovi TaxID=2874580 RepID=A0ABS7U7K8_9ACTN|nr:MFS transporter [Nocardioides mangrovi]MBZ5736716.1 MFS transporter [Nocardioides mangrovi]